MKEKKKHMNENELLLTIATPNIYKENPFRVLGLTMNVSAKDIVRKTHSLETKLDLNIDLNADDMGILPLKHLPNKDSINKACENIRNPASRVIYELFWFWPLQQSNDEGLHYLSKGRHNDALTFWRKIERADTADNIAKHNIAILYHLTALDLEAKIEDGTATQTEIDNCKSHWKSALVRWIAFVNDDGFWKIIENRILAFDDPRITIETNKSIRQILPRALLRINGQLAANAAKRSDSTAVQRQLQIINESGFDNNIIRQVLRDATKPIIEQIQLLCSPILEKAKQSPGEANKLVRSMLSEVKPLLTSLELLLPSDSILKERCFDEAAAALRECVVLYGNEAANWSECLLLTRAILNITKDARLKTLLDKDIIAIDSLITADNERIRVEQEHKRSINSNEAYEVTVTGNRIAVPPLCTCCLQEPNGQQNVSYSWTEEKAFSKVKRTVSFNFPICTECQRHQRDLTIKKYSLIGVTIAVSVVLLLLIGFELGRYEYYKYILIGMATSLVALFILNSMLRVREMSDAHSSRGDSVIMVDASKDHDYAKFRFTNYLYALAFAKGNSEKIEKTTDMKYSRKSSLLYGRSGFQVFIWVAILSFVGHSIAYSILEDNSGKSSYETSTYNNRPSLSYSRPDDSYSQKSSTLLSQINNGKQNLKNMEAEHEQTVSNLKTMASRIDSLKVSIRNYESSAAGGVYVNEYSYQQVLDEHNKLVEQYNSILGEYKENLTKYEEELKRVNDLIDRYNRRSR
ncbi:MAG: hypothetical protein ABSB11_07860 [Sedimentisphaerales bacterium]